MKKVKSRIRVEDIQDMEVMDDLGERVEKGRGVEEDGFGRGLRREIERGVRAWSEWWERRYDDDDEDEGDSTSRSRIGRRMGIVQVVLLVIVLSSIALAFVDSFSSSRRYEKDWRDRECEDGYGDRDLDSVSSNEGEGQGNSQVHDHVLRDLELVQRDSASSTSIASIASIGIAMATAVATPLRVFQVDAPVLGAKGFIFDGDNVTATGLGGGDESENGGIEGGCSVTLMEFTFAQSFGKPFVGMLRGFFLVFIFVSVRRVGWLAGWLLVVNFGR